MAEHRTEVIPCDPGYRWVCSCGEQGEPGHATKSAARSFGADHEVRGARQNDCALEARAPGRGEPS